MTDVNFHPSNEISYIETALIEKGILTQNQLDMAKFQAELDDRLGLTDAILHYGFADEQDIISIIASTMGFEDRYILTSVPDVSTLKKVSEEFPHNLSQGVAIARSQCVFGFCKEDKRVDVAVNEAMDIVARQKTTTYYKGLGYHVDFYITTRLNMALMQKTVYSGYKNYKEVFIDAIKRREDTGEGIDMLISTLFEFAALDRASDIYFTIEKGSAELSHIFFRIDRQKKYKLSLPQESAIRLAQAIKQRSGMEAGKLRGFQDGSLEVRILNNRYKLSVRVNTITVISGEQITMRIQMEDRKTLGSLGFSEDHVSRIVKKAGTLKGIIMLSGVTGSGKTTTLYSLLSNFDSDSFHIITMEDPVEIRVKGVNQIQINNQAGQSFSEAIRATLRQAPDIILLGEIRDAETASRAMEMSLTGHLVLTTLHANGLDGVEKRLMDLGVDNIKAFIENITVAIHQELVPNPSGEGMYLDYEIGFDGLAERNCSHPKN